MKRAQPKTHTRGRTIEAIQDNLVEGDVVVCARQMFTHFQRHLREYYLAEPRDDDDATAGTPAG